MFRIPTLSRYVVREILAHVLGVTAIVVGISVLRRLSGFLTEAAEGTLPGDVVFELLSLRTLSSLPSLLPAVLYLAIVLALGRLHQDREVTALESCGISPFRLARTVLLFAGLLALLVGELAFVTSPWATARFQQVRQGAVRSLEVGALAPRRFYEIGPDGKQVFFAESRSGDGPMAGVFVQDSQQDGVITIFSADSATEQMDPTTGARVLELRDGYRYDLRPAEGKHEITQYQDLTLRMQGETPSDDEGGGARVQPTAALLGSSDPGYVAELQWRLAMPISTVLLALLAIPLARIEPAQGKYARLFVAVLLYLAYHQLLVTARHWVSDGRIGVFPGLWWVHGVCLLTALGLLAWQSSAGARWSLGTRMRSAPILAAPSASRAVDS